MISLFIVAILLASCVPVEPKDMLPYCKDQYKVILEQDANFPHSYIGYCVASLQTGRPTAYTALCNYEPLWQMIEDNYAGAVVTNRSECIEFIKNPPE